MNGNGEQPQRQVWVTTRTPRAAKIMIGFFAFLFLFPVVIGILGYTGVSAAGVWLALAAGTSLLARHIL